MSAVSDLIVAMRAVRATQEAAMPDDERFEGADNAPPTSSARATRADGTKRASLVRLSEVRPQPVQWLWGGWIALGKIAIIDGDPGLGKSFLTLDIAARTSRGGTMPGDSPGVLTGTPSGVVLLTAEDDPADTLRPRLDAAGADVERIVALAGVKGDDGGDRMPRLGDLEAIREAVVSVAARLIVIDPIMAYLGGDAHRDNEVRQSLGPLSSLAAELSCAVLVVRHLNKSGGTHAVYRGGGSIAIIGAARTGMLVARDPDDETARVLAPTKSNIAELPPSLGYRLTPSGDVARIEWTGESSHGAGALLSTDETQPEARAVDEAGEWLAGELAAGPRPVSEVKSASRAAGLSWRTLERAKANAEVQARRVSEDGKPRGAGVWVWSARGDTRAVQVRQRVQGRHGGVEDSPGISGAIDLGRQVPECGGLEPFEVIS